MKFKTTQKEIKTSYKTFSISYGALQNLLRFKDAAAYTCGVYGWNADVYTFPEKGIALVTGYRPFGKSVNYDRVKYYDDLAQDVSAGFAGKWDRESSEKMREQINSILNDFISELN